MPRLYKFDMQAQRLSELSGYPQESALVFSTKPYPLLVQESVDLTHALTGGSLYVAVYNMAPEAVDLTHALTGGELRAIQQLYSWQEQVDISHSLAGGSLATVQVFYSLWPTESVDVAHSLTGGTLV